MRGKHQVYIRLPFHIWFWDGTELGTRTELSTITVRVIHWQEFEEGRAPQQDSHQVQNRISPAITLTEGQISLTSFRGNFPLGWHSGPSGSKCTNDGKEHYSFERSDGLKYTNDGKAAIVLRVVVVRYGGGRKGNITSRPAAAPLNNSSCHYGQPEGFWLWKLPRAAAIRQSCLSLKKRVVGYTGETVISCLLLALGRCKLSFWLMHSCFRTLRSWGLHPLL